MVTKFFEILAIYYETGTLNIIQSIFHLSRLLIPLFQKNTSSFETVLLKTAPKTENRWPKNGIES